MTLGSIIAALSDDTQIHETLTGLDDPVLFARVALCR